MRAVTWITLMAGNNGQPFLLFCFPIREPRSPFHAAELCCSVFQTDLSSLTLTGFIFKFRGNFRAELAILPWSRHAIFSASEVK